jgi:hypothetical protein
MLTIEIDEETAHVEDMAVVLTRVAEQLRQGFINGFDPDWRLVGEECLHRGTECAHCNAEIELEEEGTSSPHGSMHTWCAEEHEAQHPEDW